MASDRDMIIEYLKSMQIYYNFANYKTYQLRAILTKSIAERQQVCNEIIKISKKIGYKKLPSYEELFKSKTSIKELKNQLKALKQEKSPVEMFNSFLKYSFGIETDNQNKSEENIVKKKENNEEREKIIQDIKDLQFYYNFEKYSTKQLEIIRARLIKDREETCKEISRLGKFLGYGNKYNEKSLYHSRLKIDVLHGILKRLKAKEERKLIATELLNIASYLGYDTPEFIIENMDQGHKSTEDLKHIKKVLQQVLEKRKKPNYDESFAIGDDPILEEEGELLIPYDKTIKMITIIEKLRKTGKSPYLKKFSTESFKKMMEKYKDLTESQHRYLEEIDFIFLLNIYNKAVEDVDNYKIIEEEEFRHKI